MSIPVTSTSGSAIREFVTELSAAYATIGDMPRLGASVPFVARTNELAQLCATLDRVRDGQAAAVLMSGDAGVGKSRLLTEFIHAAREQGANVFLGRSLSIADSGLPYLPFTEIVEQMRLEHDNVVSSRAPLSVLTGHSVSVLSDAQKDLGQLQLFDAYLSALTELADNAPVVVALEDLHWSDPSTRDLLAFLMSRLSRQRMLILATYRTDDLHRRHPLRPLLAELTRLTAVERLDLEPFGKAESQAFVRAVGGDEVDDLAITDIAARSEGNAFFAEELLAAGATNGHELPTVLADLLLSRVEGLSPVTHRVLGAISATGRYRVRHTTLSRVLDLSADELDQALREAIQHHILITEKSGYGFRHALLREAVYSDLLPGERVRIHAAYASVIVEDGDEKRSAMLAFHSINSNNLPQALTASVKAAENSMRVGALADELAHVEKALELWHVVDAPEQLTGVDELSLTLKASYVAGAAGHRERALAFARSALPLAQLRNDPVLEANVRREMTNFLLANDLWQEATEVIHEAWSLVKDQPSSRERAWVQAMYARVAESLDVTESFAEGAIVDAKAASDGQAAQADALISLAYVATGAGDFPKAIRKLETARESARAADAPNVELRAYFNLTVTHYEQGDLETAAQLVDEGLRRAHECGLAWAPYGLELHWLAAMVHYHRGAWDESLEASTLPGENVSDTVTAMMAASRALVLVGRGEFDHAETLLTQLRSEWHRDSQITQLAGIAGAELAMWRNTPDEAPRVVDEAIDYIRKRLGDEWPMGGLRLATLALAAHADHADQARLHHDSAAEAAALTAGEKYVSFVETTAEMGVPRGNTIGPEGQAWIARMLAEQQRLHGKADPDAWQKVVDAFGHGEIYHAAHARLRLAEALVASGDREAAETALKQALSTAEDLGAKPLKDAIRALARRARISLPGATAASVGTLTSRESSVLDLVAEGLTNREIGGRLFISEKTVSVHVSRVMAKLGASGRTEAVSLAYQRGLLDPPA
jgi:ATP/maltotriose-dependent transcriptional regulator MalT